MKYCIPIYTGQVPKGMYGQAEFRDGVPWITYNMMFPLGTTLDWKQ